jgi:segregation and condensation protein A
VAPFGQARPEPLPGETAGALLLKLDAFEGPLDLLLHLIRGQKLDIADIPIALVTEQYLAYLDAMQQLDIDVAAEWLVMAATLLHIKSRMLVPAQVSPDVDAEEGDPRDELMRRLLEYERFKAAGIALGTRDLLGRDVFARTFEPPDLKDPAFAQSGPRPFAPVSISDLLTAFARALANRPRQAVHEVVIERLSLADKMTELLDRLALRESLGFEELFPPDATRAEVVISFLAVLELVRMKVVRAYQAGPFGPIRLESRSASGGGPPDPLLTTSPSPQSLGPAEPDLAPGGAATEADPGGAERGPARPHEMPGGPAREGGGEPSEGEG